MIVHIIYNEYTLNTYLLKLNWNLNWKLSLSIIYSYFFILLFFLIPEHVKKSKERKKWVWDAATVYTVYYNL